MRGSTEGSFNASTLEPLPALGVLRRLQPKNNFAFLHQIEPVARDRLQVCRIRLEQIDLARLPRKQSFLVVHLRLEVIDLGPAVGETLVRWKKETNDDEHAGQS